MLSITGSFVATSAQDMWLNLFRFALLVSWTCGEKTTCSWEACAKWKSDVLNVHLISHSHDDAGWLITVDQYYYGIAKNNFDLNHGGVQYILSTVIAQLQQDPKRRFSYCETAFFWRWWLNQSSRVKDTVKKLVNTGQLEFIGGGWVQNDEAATHYIALIDQMTLGLDKLNETFGKCANPKVAWQIDPFGHSREQASLFAQMGYDALFFSRLHYLDHKKRLDEKAAEMVWHGSDDLGTKGDLFTGHFFRQTYYPPPSICWDAQCYKKQPLMDDPQLEGNNTEKVVSELIKFAKDKQAPHFKTNHVMLLMGGDFHYTNANQWFTNLDKLIRDVNKKQKSGTKINVFYSTPSCYVKALHESGKKWPTKSDDFFPYADNPHSYWTGYFTSRPTLKGYIREMNSLLQVCKQLDATALNSMDFGDLSMLKKAVALAQHHDAVTGTERQAVTYDYEKRLYIGFTKCQNVLNTAVAKMLPLTKSAGSPPKQIFCPMTNVSVCEVSQKNEQVSVMVFNGQGKSVETYIRVPYSHKEVVVTGPNGKTKKTQIVETFTTSQLSYVKAATFEIIVPVTLPPMGFSTYFFSKSASGLETRDLQAKWPSFSRRERSPQGQTIEIENKFVKVSFDKSTGLLSEILSSGISLPVKQNLLWYKSASVSGAYSFSTVGTSANPVSKKPVQLTKINGPLVNEVRQVFSPWVSQVVRLYKNQPFVELEWTVGPIPLKHQVSKEIISHFETNIDSKSIFYTDSNGRQMMKRKRNYQPTYKYDNTEPISGNYYPINSRIFIKDDKIQLTVLTDRSQGGSSIKDGSIEIMLHRRLLSKDSKGVGEPLNEKGVNGKGIVARGKQWLLVSTPEKAAQMHRPLAFDMFHKPVITYAAPVPPYETYKQKYRTQFSGLARPLPANVHLLTLEKLKANKILLRLEHIYQKSEDPKMSKPANVDFKGLFVNFDIVSIEELTLGANKLLNETQRLHWKTMDSVHNEPSSEALRKTLPLLTDDGDPEEIITALDNVIFDKNDKIIISQMKATNLNTLEDALIEYAAQPHIVEKLEENKAFVTNCEAVRATLEGSINDEQRSLIINKLSEYDIKRFGVYSPYPHIGPFSISKVWFNLALTKGRSELSGDYLAMLKEALQGPQFPLLIGNPGEGKTMTMKRIAYEWATGELADFDLVIAVPLRDVQERSGTILDMALKCMQDRNVLKEADVNYLKSVRDSMVGEPKGKVEFSSRLHILIVLDVYDEFSSDAQCQELSELLYSRDLPNLDYCVLVTSRPYAVEDISAPVSTLKIAPLDTEQQRAYMLQHFEQEAHGDPNDRVTKLEDMLRQNRSLQEPAKTPLLLCLICILIDVLTPTDDAVQLHKLVFNSMVERYESTMSSIRRVLRISMIGVFKEPFQNICGKFHLIYKLGQMALTGLVGDTGFALDKLQFTEDDLNNFGIDYCINVGFLTIQLQGRLDEKIYEFPHKTMQEFIAALLLFDELSKCKEIKLYREDKKDRTRPKIKNINSLFRQHPMLKQVFNNKI